MGIFSNNNGKKSNEMSVNVSSKGVNVIAPETHFKGVIETSAMTQIEGFFEGDVKCENTLHIGKTGKVNGNIVADSIFIDGEIKGDISADRVEIGENGRVYANIISKGLTPVPVYDVDGKVVCEAELTFIIGR